MGHDISTQQQGRLQRRRAKAVVDGQYGSDVPTDLSQRSDICHGVERIRWRLDKEHLGIRLGRLTPLIGIGEVDKAHLNTEFLERILEQAHRSPEDVEGAQHMIPSLEMGQTQRQYGRHPDAVATAASPCSSAASRFSKP